MTYTTSVYIATSYLAIMLLNFLAYCIRQLRVKRCLYHLNTAKVDIFSLRKTIWLNFQTCFSVFRSHFNHSIKKFPTTQFPIPSALGVISSPHLNAMWKILYQCVVFKKRRRFFVHMRKCPHTSNSTWKLFHNLSDGFNFLISEQNQTS